MLAIVALVAACGGDAEVARGGALVRDLGCTSCHATSSARGLGPGWGELEWGSERPLDDGRVVIVDDDYLRRSVLDPDADVVAGWNAIMPAIPVSDAELDAITAYLRDLSGG